MSQQTKNCGKRAAGASESEKAIAHISIFDLLPNSAFVREAQLVQKPKRSKYPAPLPFSAPTLWRMVKAQTFPAPVRLSSRVTAWKVGDVRAWIVARQQAVTKEAV